MLMFKSFFEKLMRKNYFSLLMKFNALLDRFEKKFLYEKL